MQRISCIDIGTVTARLAVADVEGGRVVRLAKQSTIVDVGEGLSATGRIGEPAKERLFACVDGYLAAAREAQARVVCCTLTSAARDAENSQEVLAGLAERGLEAQVIPGEIEGMLTLLGIAQDFPNRPVLIADNGGGSTEFALGALVDGVLDVVFVRSIDVGCRRVTERFLSSRADGVVSERELAAAHEFAATEFVPVGDLLAQAELQPERLVACGGTVTSLIAMRDKIDPYDSSRVHLHELTLEDVERLEAELAPLTVDGRAQMVGLQPKRAAVILGGAVGVIELMCATGRNVLTVSESDLLFGLSLATAAAAVSECSPVGWTPTLSPLR